MPDLAAQIADHLQTVRDRIAEAALRSGRAPADVTLVAVTKYAAIGEVRALVEAGCTDLGESRPQELWRKACELNDLPIRWHLIGHLQRNKIRRTLPLATLVHSIDSLRLLAALDEEVQLQQRTVAALLEVNISGDAQKHGFRPEELPAALDRAAACPGVAIQGLMAMAAREGGPDVARQDFSRLRQLRDRLQEAFPEIRLDALSMGMSGDFEAAVEEGATLVRIGSALFEGLPS